jgi:hypothetical protein
MKRVKLIFKLLETIFLIFDLIILMQSATILQTNRVIQYQNISNDLIINKNDLNWDEWFENILKGVHNTITIGESPKKISLVKR